MSTFSITNELLADSARQTPSSGVFSFCVGQTLRKARENRDLTLDQISEQLRLTRHVIEAIEESRHLDVAQNHAYLKGFVRSYAKILELDPEAISQKFKEELPPSDEEELVFPIKTSNKTFSRKWIFFFSLAATVIVSIVSFYLVQEMHQTAVQDEPEISSLLDRPRLLFGEPVQLESKNSDALLKSFLKTGKIASSQPSGFLVSSSTRFALQRNASK